MVAAGTSEPVPVVVVGCGHLGSIHARVLSELSRARLVGVIDTDPKKASAVAARHGVETFASVDDLPECVRAAVVAVPTDRHHAVGRELLSRGVHCLIEKPIATTLDEADALIALALEVGVTLMVGHSERFNPVIRALDAFGVQPRFIDCQRVSPFSFRSTDIGVVLDMMIHDIDLILHLVGSPLQAVHAVGVPVIDGEHEDLANARLVFENGAVANATASRMALKVERKIRLFAPELYASLDLQNKTGRIIRPGPALSGGMDDLKETLAQGVANPLELMMKGIVTMTELEGDDRQPLEVEDDAFLNAVAAGSPPPVTGAQGRDALEAAQRIVHALS
ncbi:MAG TPA: Gfo/Idh/MocA family oxidoreductase [Planctomycetes bacterium]|nr:Gfo/Idh/MocA family oxidoreductase [Planctomycetota bacterium]